MIQNLIQTKYDLEVIGLIQLSPKVYKVKTKQGFYCVKIIQEKKLENAYQHIQTLHLHHFISIIKNKEDHYFTPYQDKFIYLMPYLVYKNAIQKEIKIKMYYQIIAYLHKKSFFIQSEDISFFERQKENLLSLIQIRKDEFERMMKEFEFKKYKAPSGWMLVLNYYRIVHYLNQAHYYLSQYQEIMKGKNEIRLSLTYNHFNKEHIFVSDETLISIDRMKINYCIYDLIDIFQNHDELYESLPLLEYYLKEVKLLKEEKILIQCILSIVPQVQLNLQEEVNIYQMSKLICYLDGLQEIFKKLMIDEK
mgnify:CR=1 FL=1